MDDHTTITDDMLRLNPYSLLNQTLMYIYCSEIFVYKDMNRAVRDQDETKVDFYGPFMCCLQVILKWATEYRQEHNDIQDDYRNLAHPSIVYRGLGLPNKVLTDYTIKKDNKEEVVMKGIMSCSFKRLVPLGYAIANNY